MNNKKWSGFSILLPIIAIAGCNSEGTGSGTSTNANLLTGVDCQYATYTEAVAIDSHRLQVSLPKGQCIGAKDINALRTSLPLEVGVIDPNLVVSETALVYGGYQPTYVFTVTNTSDIDLCFVRIGGISVLDSDDLAVIYNDFDYLNGDSFANSVVETSSCLKANSSGVVAEYLEYEPVDLDSAERIYIETISAKDIGGDAIQGPEFAYYDWRSENETAKLVNRTGMAVDLDSSFLSIDYFDPQGYLIASLFMEPVSTGQIVQHDEAFEIFKGAFHGAKVTELNLVMSFAYAEDLPDTKMVRSSKYFDLQELNEMQDRQTLHQESLYINSRQ